MRDKLIKNAFHDLKLISHPLSHSSLLAPRSNTTTHSQETMPAVFSRPERVQVIVGPDAALRQNPLDFFLQVMTNTNPANVPTDPDESEAFHEALHGKYVSSLTIRAPEVTNVC